MRTCRKCVIPENFPNAAIDDDGVCSYCNAHVRHRPTIRRSPERLGEILRNVKGKKTYDCIVCYSGGKDSTFTLKTLVRDYDLKAYAFTFDHGFTSPQALKNIDTVTSGLNVDQEIHRLNPEKIKEIFQTAIRELPRMPPESIYGQGMREYGPVCYVCGCIIHSLAIRLALELDAGIIATGYTPTQDPANYRHYSQKNNPVTRPDIMSAEIWLTIADIMHRFLSGYHIEGIDELFLKDVKKEDVAHLSFLRIFDFIEYDENVIFAAVKDLGWERPEDTDACSTNCLLNALGIHIYQKTMKYHPYTKQMADLVRIGLLDRDKALNDLHEDIDLKLITDISHKLGTRL